MKLVEVWPGQIMNLDSVHGVQVVAARLSDPEADPEVAAEERYHVAVLFRNGMIINPTSCPSEELARVFARDVAVRLDAVFKGNPVDFMEGMSGPAN